MDIKKIKKIEEWAGQGGPAAIRNSEIALFAVSCLTGKTPDEIYADYQDVLAAANLKILETRQKAKSELIEARKLWEKKARLFFSRAMEIERCDGIPPKKSHGWNIPCSKLREFVTADGKMQRVPCGGALDLLAPLVGVCASAAEAAKFKSFDKNWYIEQLQRHERDRFPGDFLVFYAACNNCERKTEVRFRWAIPGLEPEDSSPTVPEGPCNIPPGLNQPGGTSSMERGPEAARDPASLAGAAPVPEVSRLPEVVTAMPVPRRLFEPKLEAHAEVLS
jgi:hypothetical protein